MWCCVAMRRQRQAHGERVRGLTLSATRSGPLSYWHALVHQPAQRP
jgi:hypothetical protein